MRAAGTAACAGCGGGGRSVSHAAAGVVCPANLVVYLRFRQFVSRARYFECTQMRCGRANQRLIPAIDRAGPVAHLGIPSDPATFAVVKCWRPCSQLGHFPVRCCNVIDVIRTGDHEVPGGTLVGVKRRIVGGNGGCLPSGVDHFPRGCTQDVSRLIAVWFWALPLTDCDTAKRTRPCT